MTLPSLLRRARKYDADITYRNGTGCWRVRLFNFRRGAVVVSCDVVRFRLVNALRVALKAMEA